MTGRESVGDTWQMVVPISGISIAIEIVIKCRQCACSEAGGHLNANLTGTSAEFVVPFDGLTMEGICIWVNRVLHLCQNQVELGPFPVPCVT